MVFTFDDCVTMITFEFLDEIVHFSTMFFQTLGSGVAFETVIFVTYERSFVNYSTVVNVVLHSGKFLVGTGLTDGLKSRLADSFLERFLGFFFDDEARLGRIHGGIPDLNRSPEFGIFADFYIGIWKSRKSEFY